MLSGASARVAPPDSRAGRQCGALRACRAPQTGAQGWVDGRPDDYRLALCVITL